MKETITLILIFSIIIGGLCDFIPPSAVSEDPKILLQDVKCLVCKVTIDEMETAISKIDPKKRAEVGGGRIIDGINVAKTIQYSKSETYLTELMEVVCEKMDDYAKVRYKNSRKLSVMKLTTDTGGMNPDISSVDFIHDGDLNKSLKHYCLEILEDNEEVILKLFMKEEVPKNIDHKLCTETAGYCDDEIEEYHREEL